jgi:hypothetical protein
MIKNASWFPAERSGGADVGPIGKCRGGGMLPRAGQPWRHFMKRLLTAAACAALFAAPSFAQTLPSGDGDANVSAPAPAVECPTLPDSAPDQPCPANLGSGSGPLSLATLPSETTGIIASIDVAAGTVTLDDGKTFAMENKVALNTFNTGQRVTVSYMNQDGKLLANDIKVAASSEPPENAFEPPAAYDSR